MKTPISQIIFSLLTFLSLTILLSCQYFGSVLVNSNADFSPREEFVNSISLMYEDVGLTEHFPVSWQNTNLRTKDWNASYFSPCEDSSCHCYRCMACFIDKVSYKYMDTLISNLNYKYKKKFYNDSLLKFNPVYIKHSSYPLQSHFDTTYMPIYDFSEAVFNNNVMEDSLYFDGQFWYGEHQVPPSDLVVYVIDAKAGNYWTNKNEAEKENRSVLPQRWKHGFSRGIAVSHSCQKVCWWTMAW